MNFVIPFHLQDLQSRSSPQQYVIDEVFSSRLIPIKLQSTKIAFARDGGVAVLEHFDVIYSVIHRFSELDAVIKQQTWEILMNGCKTYCNSLANMLCDTTESPMSPKFDVALRQSHKNTLKMNVYLITQLADLYLSAYNQSMAESMSTTVQGGKGRKGIKSKHTATQDNKWPAECEKIVRLMINFVDLDIHRLWDPDLVEDDFLNLLSNLCYKILECQSLVKMNDIKDTVFHLLGCMVKKFSQSMGTSLKLVQLLQHFNHLSIILAEAVNLWQNSYKCKSIVSEVLRELSHIPEKEFQRDSESAKNFGSFLVELSRQTPNAVLANFSLMLTRMNEESYTMRSTVLSMMGEIIMHCLTGEGLDAKAKSARDQFLDYLYDHANLDPNAFTRCKALQIWISLVREQALPLKRYPDLVELCSSLLLDRSNLVRRFTVQLLEGILRFNPFASKLPIDVLQAGHDEAKEKLEQMIKEYEATKSKEKEDEEDTQQEKDSDEEEEEADISVFEEADEDSETVEKEKSETPEISKQRDIVNYLQNSVRFVQQFHACVPVLCELLRSHVHSDIIEAISFFTAAWEFKLSFALVGVTAMLQQIWHEEQKIRDAVVAAYKQLYFTPDGTSSRAKASVVADNLMSLASVSGTGKLKSLEALIQHLSKSGDIPPGVALIFWDRFSKPELNNSTVPLDPFEQQNLAVQLIGFLAGTNPSVIRNKIDILVAYGLRNVVQKELGQDTTETRRADFSLALQTCITLSKLGARKHAAGEYEKSMRLPEMHEMFTCLKDLIVKGYPVISDNWEHFASEAIALIYNLAECPDMICERMIHQILAVVTRNADCENKTKKQMLLTRFYLVCGQITIKQLVYLEVAVQSELKHRRKLKEEKQEAEEKKKDREKNKKAGKSKGDKTESNLEEDMGVGGATADDIEQEFIRNITENELLAKDNLLGLLAPILVRACLAPIHADRVGEVAVQASASLGLAKYMQVSSSFCESHLQLLFTLLEKSPHETVRANLVIPIGDLCVRFPNLLEPWTSHLYARLKDQSSLVRIYAVKVLSNLILNDMVKVKGHVSEMARCTVDDNEQIASLAKKFFQELSKKGNSIYNVMPDIISRLSDPDVGMNDDEQFRVIMRFLFSFIHKDKQSESLVEKLCHRFSATRVKRQWQDLAFCLSLLSYSEKSIRRLQENFTCFADKLSNEHVHLSFSTIIAKARKFCKPELKAQVDELEVLIDECHQKGVSDDHTAAKAAAVVKKSRRVSSIRSPRSFIAWPARGPGTSTADAGEHSGLPTGRGRKRQVNIRSDNDESESDDEDFEEQPAAREEPNPLLTRPVVVLRRLRSSQRRVMEFSSDEDDDSKENVASPSQPDADVIQNEGGDDTPIRRKDRTRMLRSTLRA